MHALLLGDVPRPILQQRLPRQQPFRSHGDGWLRCVIKSDLVRPESAVGSAPVALASAEDRADRISRGGADDRVDRDGVAADELSAAGGDGCPPLSLASSGWVTEGIAPPGARRCMGREKEREEGEEGEELMAYARVR